MQVHLHNYLNCSDFLHLVHFWVASRDGSTSLSLGKLVSKSTSKNLWGSLTLYHLSPVSFTLRLVIRIYLPIILETIF